MPDVVDTPLSHGQLEVSGGPVDEPLDLFVIGDGLLSRTGADRLTVLAGLHTGTVRVRAAEVDALPDPDEAWAAESEDTLWSPEGRVAVAGLMTWPPDGLGDVVAGGPGLYRVRVRARHRRPEGTADAAPEEFEVLLRRTDVDPGPVTHRSDGLASGSRNLAAAAAWAVGRWAAEADPPPLQRQFLALRPTPPGPRAAVHRRRDVPQDADPATWLGAHRDGDDLLLPLGPLTVRLTEHPTGYTWTWPLDPEPSTVELRREGTWLEIRHTGVRATDAIGLGLLWDHLLDRAATGADGPPAG